VILRRSITPGKRAVVAQPGTMVMALATSATKILAWESGLKALPVERRELCRQLIAIERRTLANLVTAARLNL
jgi:RecB family endonuclease NucS